MAYTKRQLKQQAQWDAMTEAERRVEIAKDVKESIQAGEYGKIATNHYVYGCFESSGKMCPTRQDIQAIKQSCSMCARGALLISRVAKFNKLSFHDLSARNGKAWTDEEETTEGLKGAFTERQLKSIEQAFEGWDSDGTRLEGVRDEDDPHVVFHNSHPNAEDRLLAIVQNIIDHDGDFKP